MVEIVEDVAGNTCMDEASRARGSRLAALAAARLRVVASWRLSVRLGAKTYGSHAGMRSGAATIHTVNLTAPARGSADVQGPSAFGAPTVAIW